jgi:SARP family transcriptional regulator, regulator of embCAB operon
MEILALGALEVRAHRRRIGPADLGGRKPKQVLELLVAAGGKPVPKEQLVDQLWGDRPPHHPLPALENHVWVLRRHLAPTSEPIVVAEAGAYRLATERVSLDLDRFDALAHVTGGGDPARTRTQLEQALALVRGEVFEDEPYAEWVLSLRQTYRGKVTRLRLDVAELALLDGECSSAMEQSERVLREDAFSERACRLQMIGLAQCGEREQALRAYGALRRRLRAELGVQPSRETVVLGEAIRHGANSRPRDLLRPSPYLRGGARRATPLAPRAGSAPALVGRKRDVRHLVDAVERGIADAPGIVLVEGLAHVGKTRVVEEACRSLHHLSSVWARFTPATRGLSDLVLTAALLDPAAGGRRDPMPGLDPFETIRCELVRRAPTMLVLDDLQHADAEVVTALAHLRLRAAGTAAVVVGILRCEDLATDHVLRSLPLTERLRLEPLVRQDLGPEAPEILARTGGYGRYIAAWSRGELDGELPGELQEAVLARCRSAGSRAYRVLAVASVLPEPITVGAVTDATGIRCHHVAEELDRLAARGLLQDLGSLGFRFDCTLVAAVLRGQISASRRTVLQGAPLTGSGGRRPVP